MRVARCGGLMRRSIYGFVWVVAGKDLNLRPPGYEFEGATSAQVQHVVSAALFLRQCPRLSDAMAVGPRPWLSIWLSVCC